VTENIIERTWHDAPHLFITDHTSHGMRLARTCLTVSKDGTVVALEDVHDDWRRRFLINCTLTNEVVVNQIECELFGIVCAVWTLNDNLAALLISVYDLGVALADFLRVDRPHTDRHLD